jgi:hypothetical protein
VSGEHAPELLTIDRVGVRRAYLDALMRPSNQLDSDNYDKRLYAEFWRRDDPWARVKSRIMPGIVLVGAVSGIAWIVRSVA